MQLTTPTPDVDFRVYKLSSRQAKFVQLLVQDPTIPQYKAYRNIYLTKTKASAASGAAKMLAKSNIQDYKAALESISAANAIKSNEITQSRILEEEACIAFHDIGGLLDEDGFFIKNLRDLPEAIRRNIAGLEITERVDPTTGRTVPYFKLKFNDKGRSLERLEKHLGMLKERVEIGVEVTLKGLIATIDGKKTGKPMIPHLKDD